MHALRDDFFLNSVDITIMILATPSRSAAILRREQAHPSYTEEVSGLHIISCLVTLPAARETIPVKQGTQGRPVQLVLVAKAPVDAIAARDQAII